MMLFMLMIALACAVLAVGVVYLIAELIVVIQTMKLLQKAAKEWDRDLDQSAALQED